MTKEEKMELAHHAQALMNNKATHAIFQMMRQETFAAIESSAPDEEKKREGLYFLLLALREHELRLRALAKSVETETLRTISRSHLT